MKIIKKLNIVLVSFIILELISIFSIPVVKDQAVLGLNTRKQTVNKLVKIQKLEDSNVEVLLSPSPKLNEEVLDSITKESNSNIPLTLTPTPVPTSASTPVTPTPTPIPAQQSDNVIPPAVNNNGWIKGKVMIGPTCPGSIRIDQDGNRNNCQDKPYEASITVKNENGESEIASTKSDSNGEFKVELPPGIYMVIAGNSDKNIDRFPSPQSQIITVETNKTTQISFSLDSGIR